MGIIKDLAISILNNTGPEAYNKSMDGKIAQEEIKVQKMSEMKKLFMETSLKTRDEWQQKALLNDMKK